MGSGPILDGRSGPLRVASLADPAMLLAAMRRVGEPVVVRPRCSIHENPVARLTVPGATLRSGLSGRLLVALFNALARLPCAVQSVAAVVRQL